MKRLTYHMKSITYIIFLMIIISKYYPNVKIDFICKVILTVIN